MQKPRKKPMKGTRTHTLRKSMKMTLGAGMPIHECVRLPPGENKLEWIAMNTMEVFNTVDLVYDLIRESCTPEHCPTMNAAGGISYLWADERQKKPVQLPAPEYVQTLLNWISCKFDDPTIFPVDGGKFTRSFLSIVKRILKRMFRIYAHIHHQHMSVISEIGATEHFYTSFKHFYFFVKEFKLVSESDMLPMQQQIKLFEEELKPQKKQKVRPKSPSTEPTSST